MKRLLLLAFSFYLLVSPAQAQWSGSGTQNDPYLINNFADWSRLAKNVNTGVSTYNGKYFRLMSNIRVEQTFSNNADTTSVGSSDDNSFQGIFDGNGHTIEIHYFDFRNQDFCAPFRYIHGATIKNLHVSGGINKYVFSPETPSQTQHRKNSAGFVGKATGVNTITNCRSSANIYAAGGNDCSSGGFVGEIRDNGSSVTFTSCLFDGKLRGAREWGGFVGWVASGSTATFNDCFFAPEEVGISGNSNKTFARHDGTVTVNGNSYYLYALSNDQGRKGYAITGTASVDFSRTETPHYDPVSHITTFSSGNSLLYGIKCKGVYYAGSGDILTLAISQVGDTPAGCIGGSFMVYPGTLSTTGSNYRLTMPDDTALITLAPVDFAAANTGSATDPYIIHNAEQWNLLASNVGIGTSYTGKHFRLAADITVTGMVGTSDYRFSGTFDGAGHTLTFYYDGGNTNHIAPFGFVDGATIRYLHTAGHIRKTGGKYTGGLIGGAKGNNSIRNCRTSTHIEYSGITDRDYDVSSGGFIGELRGGGTTTFANCLSHGYLDGGYVASGDHQGDPSTVGWGGFVGWVASGNTAVFDSCLFSASTCWHTGSDNRDFARSDGTVTLHKCYNMGWASDGAQGNQMTGMYGFNNHEQRCQTLGDGWELYSGNLQPIMVVRSFAGQGTAQSPWLIGSYDDWQALASNIYLDQSYSGKHFRLTADINIVRMVGCHPAQNTYKTFNGTFDGDGHTINITRNETAEFCGPFAYTYGATIQNLITTGTITTSHKHAGGVVGRNGTARLTLRNVHSSVTINSTYSGSAEHGGLVGYTINADLIGCAFVGSLLGTTSYGCGGLIGWKTNTSNSSANITDCLFAPASVTVGTTNAYTLARNSSGGVVNVINSYYTQTLGTNQSAGTPGQGKLRHSITAEPHLTLRNVGPVTEYNVSGIRSYGVGIGMNDELFAGLGDSVSLYLHYDIPGFTVDGYNVTTLNNTDIPIGSVLNPLTDHPELEMPDYDCLVSTLYHVTPWSGSGTEADPYLIEGYGQLDLLSQRVGGRDGQQQNSYADTWFKLVNDIEYYDIPTHGDYTPVGTRELAPYYRPFNGHLDGDGHVVKGIRCTGLGNDRYNGLFTCIGASGEVKNVILGDVQFGGGAFVGGIAGVNQGTVRDCYVTKDATLSCSQTSGILGGIVGQNTGAAATVTGCIFAGTLNDGDNQIANLGGIAGHNTLGATLDSNLVYGNYIIGVSQSGFSGACFPSMHSGYGIIAGQSDAGGALSRNYYLAAFTRVAGNANNTGKGCDNADIDVNDAAMPAIDLTFLSNAIISDAASFTIPAYGTAGEMSLRMAALGSTVSLHYRYDSACNVTYYINDFINPETSTTANSFIMPTAYNHFFPNVSVDAAIDVNAAADRWLAVSTPVHDINNNSSEFLYQVDGLVPSNNDNVFAYDLFRYDEPTSTWQNQKAHDDFSTLLLGKGYLYRRGEAATLHFRGMPNEEDVSVTLTATGTLGDRAGFNLVGNPFPFRVFVDRPFYALAPNGSWTAHPYGDSIAVAQAILVHTDVPGGETLTFHFATRTTGAAPDLQLPALPSLINSLTQLDIHTFSHSDTAPFAYYDGTSLVVTGTGTLEIYDLLGRRLLTREINSQFSILNFQFPGGVYLLRLSSRHQKILIP